MNVVSLPVTNPLMQLSAVIRMLRDMVDPGVLLQQAPGEQAGQVTPGGWPSGPLLLVKRPLICDPIAPLHNLQPPNCLSVPAPALVWQQCSLLSAVAALERNSTKQQRTHQRVAGNMTCCNSRQKIPEVVALSLAHAKCALNAASSLRGREPEAAVAVALLLSVLQAEQKQRNDTRGSIVPSSTSKTAAGGETAASGVISLLLLSL